MLLIKLIRTRARVSLRGVIALSALAAISTTLILMVVNMAAEQASNGDVSLRLLALMAVSVLGFAWAQKKANLITAREVEYILHDMRVRLFDGVRAAGPDLLARIGQGRLQSALTQEMQNISTSLPMILIGVQQMVMLVFVSLYLASLSVIAFVMIAIFSAVAAFVHIHRMRAVLAAGQKATADEGRLFGGLTDLLHGFKEVRLNRTREQDLLTDLHGFSHDARTAKTTIKEQWGREFAMIQLAFYLMMGMMVFVVPMFTTDYHDMAMQTTTAALFMIGPIGAFMQTIPALGDAENALSRLNALDQEMQDELARDHHGSDNTAQWPALDPREIVLRDASFAYRDPTDGRGFAVGPLSITFRRGEISFITGGNGSGKSTLIALLTGLRPVASGAIAVDDVDIDPTRMQSWRDCIATVFSDYHLFSELYGHEDIDPDQANRLLHQMEIDTKVTLTGNRFSTTDLSQGQRKRLALVAALLENKPVLVLDEWAADQDPHFRAFFYEKLLPELRAQGKMIICVTHDDRWFDRADHIYHMRDGQIETVK
ncbi:cyclic peptide export ABC transporter [Thalassospira sp.]|uniref:cyclic peptide export ABC transporter n=1 Tax=Thalassospira sp. TaxID=1912094 RepID=UPI002736C9AF|nr:cyclic peptide export ABC transporter [Thalassospira sp.]MDP2699984.1 cyclic peptide export ABC transporter [Thalassospira sp.]